MNFRLSGTLFTLAKAWNLPKCLQVNASSKYQNIYSQQKKFKSTLLGGGQGILRYSSLVAQINKSTLQRHTEEAYKRDSHTVKPLHTKHGCIIGTNSFLFVYFPYFPGSFPSGLVHIQMFHWLSMSMVQWVQGLALDVRVSASKTKQSRAVPHSFNSSLSTMHRALVRFDPPHHIRCVWCVWVWWYISVIPRHERWRQEELKFSHPLLHIKFQASQPEIWWPRLSQRKKTLEISTKIPEYNRISTL